jgi:hypothetical protein
MEISRLPVPGTFDSIIRPGLGVSHPECVPDHTVTPYLQLAGSDSSDRNSGITITIIHQLRRHWGLCGPS